MLLGVSACNGKHEGLDLTDRTFYEIKHRSADALESEDTYTAPILSKSMPWGVKVSYQLVASRDDSAIGNGEDPVYKHGVYLVNTTYPNSKPYTSITSNNIFLKMSKSARYYPKCPDTRNLIDVDGTKVDVRSNIEHKSLAYCREGTYADLDRNRLEKSLGVGRGYEARVVYNNYNSSILYFPDHYVRGYMDYFYNYLSFGAELKVLREIDITKRGIDKHLKGKYVVVDIKEDGVAMSSGIKVNDIIDQVNGKVLRKSNMYKIMSARSGSTRDLTILRPGEGKHIDAVSVIVRYDK